MTLGIDYYDDPDTFGDWLGVNGPRYDSSKHDEEVAHGRDLGLRWCRYNLDFPACCRPEMLDRMCRALEVCMSFEVAPIACFSHTDFDGHSQPNLLPDDAGLEHYEMQLLPVVARLYDVGVRVFESHNEWNGPGVKGQPESRRTARVFAATHSVVHAVAEQAGEHALMLCGGTGATEDVGWYAPAAYERLLQEPGGPSFDAVAHHAGAFPYDPHVPEKRFEDWNGFYQTLWVRDVAATVRPGVRCWVTEAPYPSPPNGFDSEHDAAVRCARDLAHLIDWCRRGICGPVILYHGCPDGAQGHDDSAGFGIRRADGADKEICDVLAEVAAQPFALASAVD